METEGYFGFVNPNTFNPSVPKALTLQSSVSVGDGALMFAKERVMGLGVRQICFSFLFREIFFFLNNYFFIWTSRCINGYVAGVPHG